MCKCGCVRGLKLYRSSPRRYEWNTDLSDEQHGPTLNCSISFESLDATGSRKRIYSRSLIWELFDNIYVWVHYASWSWCFFTTISLVHFVHYAYHTYGWVWLGVWLHSYLRCTSMCVMCERMSNDHMCGVVRDIQHTEKDLTQARFEIRVFQSSTTQNILISFRFLIHKQT